MNAALRDEVRAGRAWAAVAPMPVDGDVVEFWAWVVPDIGVAGFGETAEAARHWAVEDEIDTWLQMEDGVSLVTFLSEVLVGGRPILMRGSAEMLFHLSTHNRSARMQVAMMEFIDRLKGRQRAA